MMSALCIAVRYSAVRRQFGPPGGEETPVLEYQLQQWRLMPYLAASYVLEHFANTLFMDFVAFQIGIMGGDTSDRQADLGREIHAIVCAAKAYCAWIGRDAIQECREACGGHGYFYVNRIGTIRNDHDPNMTFEGDNNVILQQTSNYLLSLLAAKRNRGQEITTPLESLDFLENMDEILQSQFRAQSIDDCMNMEVVVHAYKWLVLKLLVDSAARLQKELDSGKDSFSARNDSQAYYCRTLALVYVEHANINRYYQMLQGEDDEAVPDDLHPVLQKLGSLFALWSLEKHIATLYQGGYITGSAPPYLIRESILRLCREVKDESIALIDAVAPTDFVLDSPIGHSDGQAYKNLYSAMLQTPDVFKRPDWWKEFVNKPLVGALRQAKL
ncbi:hypothetical protein ScPMuIL_005421 [Solemya velum]